MENTGPEKIKPRALNGVGVESADCINKATGTKPLGIEKISSTKSAILERRSMVMVFCSSLAPAAPRRSVICDEWSESFATATPKRYPAAVGKMNSEAVPLGDE